MASLKWDFPKAHIFTTTIFWQHSTQWKIANYLNVVKNVKLVKSTGNQVPPTGKAF